MTKSLWMKPFSMDCWTSLDCTTTSHWHRIIKFLQFIRRNFCSLSKSTDCYIWWNFSLFSPYDRWRCGRRERIHRHYDMSQCSASALRWLVRMSTVKRSQQNTQHAGVVAEIVLFFSFLLCAKIKREKNEEKIVVLCGRMYWCYKLRVYWSRITHWMEKRRHEQGLHVCAFCMRRQQTETTTETLVSYYCGGGVCAFVCDWRK